MRSVRIALAAGLALLAAAGGVVLSRSPLTSLEPNPAAIEAPLVSGKADVSFCQAGERLPRGTLAIRLAVASSLGPALALQVRDGRGVLASGALAAGWVGRTVTIPVRRVARTLAPVSVCLTIAPGEDVGLFGRPSAAALAAQPLAAPAGQDALPGRVSIEYLGKGQASWLALASSVAAHMSRGRAWSGLWVVFLVIGLTFAMAALASRLTLRELGGSPRGRSRGARRRAGRRRRVPAAAWVAALVACLNAVSWSFITPPFQVPDEPSHFAYVKQLAETGTLPTSSSEAFSAEETFALDGLGFQQTRLDASHRAILSQAQQDSLDAGLEALNRARRGEGSPAAGVAASEPPLYYGLESIPYLLGSGGTLLERLQLMRLLSALLAGVTALFTFMFLREALPRARWAWTVGTLGVALSPLFAFTSGGVTPDALLCAASAALFYCLARGFRRGLSERSALATGAAIAAGLLTKLTFLGLLPGALVALAIVGARAVREHDRGPGRDAPCEEPRHSPRRALRALAPAALAALLGCAPILAFAAHNLLLRRPILNSVTSTAAEAGHSLLGEANYTWQLYLPPLPGTAVDFPGFSTARLFWFDGYIGRLGWLDTFFPGWVYTLALLACLPIAALLLRALLARRAALRERLAELAVYALMALGLLAIVGDASYGEFPRLLADFGQARYLLALLPLLGAALALAARGAGRRLGPAAGVLIVVLVLANDLFGQLQVIARYYG
jgi:hypothetical protein